jgi:hypothetical protein
MPQKTALESPLDANYTEHRDADQRHQETLDWLKRRELELGFIKDAPSVAPDEKRKD